MERSVVIDSARALAMLYIVGYWHIFDYTRAFMGYNNIYTEALTTTALAVFSLISGYLLSQKNEILSVSDLMRFYRRRFLRIYPLYSIAILGFGFMTFYPFDLLYKPLLGLTIFSPPQIITLWFMVMLLFFYIITPIFLFSFNKECLGLVSVLAMVSLILYHQGYGTLDIRVLTYLPIFIGGIWIGKTRSIDTLLRHWPTLVLSVIILFSGFKLANSGLQGFFIQIPLAASGSILFLFMAKHLSSVLPSKLFFWGSYASFSIYLFHRIFYHLLIGLYFPETPDFQVIYLYVVLLPLVCLFSFLIQFSYDWTFKLIGDLFPEAPL